MMPFPLGATFSTQEGTRIRLDRKEQHAGGAPRWVFVGVAFGDANREYWMDEAGTFTTWERREGELYPEDEGLNDYDRLSEEEEAMMWKPLGIEDWTLADLQRVAA